MKRFSPLERSLLVVLGLLTFVLVALLIPTGSAYWRESLRGSGAVYISDLTSTPPAFRPVWTATLEQPPMTRGPIPTLAGPTARYTQTPRGSDTPALPPSPTASFTPPSPTDTRTLAPTPTHTETASETPVSTPTDTPAPSATLTGQVTPDSDQPETPSTSG